MVSLSRELLRGESHACVHRPEHGRARQLTTTNELQRMRIRTRHGQGRKAQQCRRHCNSEAMLHITHIV